MKKSRVEEIKHFMINYHFTPLISHYLFLRKAAFIDVDPPIGVEDECILFNKYDVYIKRYSYSSAHIAGSDNTYSLVEYQYYGEEDNFAQAINQITHKIMLLCPYADKYVIDIDMIWNGVASQLK